MKTVPLEQICDIQIGKTPSRSVPEYWGGQLPWVTISDFAAGRIVTTTKERITRIGAAKSRSKCIPRGTLLLSFKLSLGKRTIAGRDLFTNEAIAALRILDHHAADRDYLYWALGSIDYDRLVDRAAKGKTLNKAKLKLLRIPLPPLIKQKRIARILDAADALRAKRREALAQLDDLLQSTFLDMFGDPVTNPMGWTKVRSGELLLLPPKIGTITPAAGRGYLVVRVGEIGESRIAFERCGRVEISEKDFAKFRLERGDTVIARAIGSKNHLGKASFFAGFDEATVIDSHVMRLRPDPIKCDGLWLYSLISSDRGKVLLQQTGGATAVQFNINAKQASSMQVALPPLDLQHHFAAIVESVERQKASQRAHLAELDTLFASLQSRAFRGDL